MLRPTILALALVATPALASHYQAEPAAKPAAAKIILRDTIWSCTDAGCAAGRSNSRPAIVCEVLVKEVGALKSFSVAGRPLSAAELEKCNARAG
jgi:hypothetical protein